MQSKSSTSLAIISILAIMIVFFIGVSNVEDSPQRRPFPTEGADNKEVVKVNEMGENGENPKILAENAAIEMSSSSKINFVETPDSRDTQPKITEITPETSNQNTSTTASDGEKIDSAATPENFLVKNVSSELLMKAGFNNVVVKPRPFNGRLFDRFDLDMLSYLNIVEKSVIQIIDGNETEVLRVYEFDFSDDAGAQEIYDFLKAKIKDELGVTINETNQFGLSSFYVNFNSNSEKAFLVVKTRTNVYALSYPKAKINNINYFDLVSNLLKELI